MLAGATFLITNLEPDTVYLMRAASRNLAGFSDFTKVEKYKTLSLEPRSASAILHPTALLLGLMLTFGSMLRVSFG